MNSSNTSASSGKEKKVEYFFLESKNPSITPQIITDFFSKKDIIVCEIAEQSRSDKITTYKIGYEYSSDVILTIELIKKQSSYENLDIKITRIEVKCDFFEIVNKKLEEEKKTTKFTYPKKYEDEVHKNYLKNMGAPGLEYINHEMMKRSRDVMAYLLKTAGKNILNGKSIMNISLPINICGYRSNIEMLAYNIRNHSYFLEAGANASSIERMKLVVANYVSSLHFMLAGDKPFNAIIGETFQIKSGNTLFYAEQTSHHPPVTNFYIVNPNFKMWGHNGVDFSLGANSATGRITGTFMLSYNDGTEYKLTYPSFYSQGFMVGKTYMTFTSGMLIEDLKNNLIAYIRFNPDDRSFFSKLFPKNTYPDYFAGYIGSKDDATLNKSGEYTIDEKNIYSKIEGEFTRFLNIDDDCYWIHEEQKLTDLERFGFILPSDSQYRPDIVLWKMGLEEKGQEAKSYLEEIQRRDRDLRAKFTK